MPESSDLIHALQSAGLRLTPQRMAICRLLAQTDRHPTAQMLYDWLRPEFPSLSLATVYNTLDRLVQLGVVNSLGSAGDDAVHYDADTEPHINLACTSCHRVIDLSSRHVLALDEEITTRTGYRMLGARVLYYGVCPECQAKANRQQTDPA